MSVVTNLIFTHSILEAGRVIKKVNVFFEGNRGDKPLISCDNYKYVPIRWYGGSKMLECPLYIGGF